MADPVVPPVEPVVVAPVVEAAPVVAAPAPVVAETAPVVAPIEPVVAETAPVEPVREPTLLEKFDAKTAAAAKEAPKVEDAPKTEEPKVEAKTEEPKVEPKTEGEPKVEVAPEPVAIEPLKFEATLPEGVTLSDTQRTDLEGILGAIRTAPTAENQQKLVDLHTSLVRDAVLGYQNAAHAYFNQQQRTWEAEIMADPFIGGGNHDAAMQSIAYVRDNFVSDAPLGSKQWEADQRALNEDLTRSGMGSNPRFMRWAHRIARALGEPEMTATSDIKPMPAQEDRDRGGNGRRAPIYRHTTSFRNGR